MKSFADINMIVVLSSHLESDKSPYASSAQRGAGQTSASGGRDRPMSGFNLANLIYLM